MLLRNQIHVLVAAIFLASGVSASAGEQVSPRPKSGVDPNGVTSTWWGDAKRGYYWYEDPPEPAEEAPAEQPQPAIEPPAQEKPERKLPSLADYTMEQLWSMHPEDFEPLLTSFRNKAIQSPSVDNVTEYRIVEDVARRRAVNFANVFAYVARTNPNFMQLNLDAPVSTPAKRVDTRMQAASLVETLSSMRDAFAIVFFTKQGCPYCEAEERVLMSFVEETGWTVKPVDILARPELAERFNIQRTPTLILISKGVQEHFPLGIGFQPLDTLKKSLYQGIRFLRGDTSPDNFMIWDYQDGGPMDPRSILTNPDPASVMFRRDSTIKDIR